MSISRKVHIIKDGRIFHAKAEAIVCDISPSFMPDNHIDGMAERLFLLAGEKLKDACKNHWELSKGMAWTFDSYDYALRDEGVGKIIFVCGPSHFKGISRAEAMGILRACYKNALDEAKKNNIHSVVFPTISLGSFYGFKRQEQAIIAMDIVFQWFEDNKNYNLEVNFCLFKHPKWGNRERDLFYHFRSYYEAGRFLHGAGRNKRKALILSGGGACGAFELGVWEILSEYGISGDITGIAGTSIGALNTVLFSMPGTDAERRKIWEDISPQTLSPFFDRDQKKLKHAIKKAFDKIGNSYIERDLFVCETKLSTKSNSFLDRRYYRIDDISSTDAQNYVLGSAAHSIIYNPKHGFIDGGTLGLIKEKTEAIIPFDVGLSHLENTNTPIQPLYSIGYRDFIVVYLEPHINSEIEEETKRYGDASFYRIYPSHGLGDIFKISKEKTEYRIKEGRKAAMKLL